MSIRPGKSALRLMLLGGILLVMAGCSADGRRFLGVVPIPHRFRPFIQYWESPPDTTNPTSPIPTPPPMVTIDPQWVTFHYDGKPGSVPLDYGLRRISSVGAKGDPKIDNILVASTAAADNYMAQIPTDRLIPGNTYEVDAYFQGDPQALASEVFTLTIATPTPIPTGSASPTPTPMPSASSSAGVIIAVPTILP